MPAQHFVVAYPSILHRLAHHCHTFSVCHRSILLQGHPSLRALRLKDTANQSLLHLQLAASRVDATGGTCNCIPHWCARLPVHNRPMQGFTHLHHQPLHQRKCIDSILLRWQAQPFPVQSLHMPAVGLVVLRHRGYSVHSPISRASRNGLFFLGGSDIAAHL
jgi:hypothetical protein